MHAIPLAGAGDYREPVGGIRRQANRLYNAFMTNTSPNTSVPLRYGAPISMAGARRVMAAAGHAYGKRGSTSLTVSPHTYSPTPNMP